MHSVSFSFSSFFWLHVLRLGRKSNALGIVREYAID